MLLNTQHEVQPVMLVRMTPQGPEFARWRINNGEDAIAMFLDVASAQKYQDSLQETGWKVWKPTVLELLTVFRGCLQLGIHNAVLEPDISSAKRIFSIQDLVMAGDSLAKE